MVALTSTEIHDFKAWKIIGFNPEDGSNRFLRKLVIYSGDHITSPNIQCLHPEDDSNTFLRNICKLTPDYTTRTPGPWRGTRQEPPKVSEFLSHRTISHSGSQKSFSHQREDHKPSHTVISFAVERGATSDRSAWLRATRKIKNGNKVELI
jgi:hypothetical protein